MYKILIVNHTENFRGGAERSNLLFAESLVSRGHFPILLFPSLVVSPSEEQRIYRMILTPKHDGALKRAGLIVYLNIFIKRLFYLFWLIRNRRLFIDIDYVVCVTNRTCSEFVFFKFLMKKKTFYFNRGYDSNLMLKYILFNFADKIITLNGERRMPFVLRKKFVVANNYLKWNNYPFFLEKPIGVVSVGRASNIKGIDIFSYTSSHFPEIPFKRYGHGCGSFKFSGNVAAKEFADQLEIYSSGSVFLSTSRNEDFPRVFIEAIASGLLIVAFHFNGIERFRKDGITLWFTDDLMQLKIQLKSALSLSGESRREICQRNLELAKVIYSDYFIDELF